VKLTVSEQIEELRLQMQKIALDKELTDPRVVMRWLTKVLRGPKKKKDVVQGRAIELSLFCDSSCGVAGIISPRSSAIISKVVSQ